MSNPIQLDRLQDIPNTIVASNYVYYTVKDPTIEPIQAVKGTLAIGVAEMGGKLWTKQDTGKTTNWVQVANLVQDTFDADFIVDAEIALAEVAEGTLDKFGEALTLNTPILFKALSDQKESLYKLTQWYIAGVQPALFEDLIIGSKLNTLALHPKEINLCIAVTPTTATWQATSLPIGVNLGGEGVFKEMVGNVFQFKGLESGSNVVVEPTATTLRINGAGIVNLGADPDKGLFKGAMGLNRQFRRLRAGTNITLNYVAPDENEIEISASGGGTEIVTITEGGTYGSFKDKIIIIDQPETGDPNIFYNTIFGDIENCIIYFKQVGISGNDPSGTASYTFTGNFINSLLIALPDCCYTTGATMDTPKIYIVPTTGKLLVNSKILLNSPYSDSPPDHHQFQLQLGSNTITSLRMYHCEIYAKLIYTHSSANLTIDVFDSIIRCDQFSTYSGSVIWLKNGSYLLGASVYLRETLHIGYGSELRVHGTLFSQTGTAFALYKGGCCHIGKLTGGALNSITDGSYDISILCDYSDNKKYHSVDATNTFQAGNY